eukprot:768628-Hanusia_phi.AAC.19
MEILDKENIDQQERTTNVQSHRRMNYLSNIAIGGRAGLHFKNNHVDTPASIRDESVNDPKKSNKRVCFEIDQNVIANQNISFLQASLISKEQKVFRVLPEKKCQVEEGENKTEMQQQQNVPQGVEELEDNHEEEKLALAEKSYSEEVITEEMCSSLNKTEEKADVQGDLQTIPNIEIEGRGTFVPGCLLYTCSIAADLQTAASVEKGSRRKARDETLRIAVQKARGADESRSLLEISSPATKTISFKRSDEVMREKLVVVESLGLTLVNSDNMDVLVAHVDRNHPAYRAGVRSGDLIVSLCFRLDPSTAQDEIQERLLKMDDDGVIIIEEDQELVAIPKSDEKIQRMLQGSSSFSDLAALGSKRISGMNVRDMETLFAHEPTLAVILGLAVNYERLNVSIQDFASDYDGLVESSESIVRYMKWIQIDTDACVSNQKDGRCCRRATATERSLHLAQAEGILPSGAPMTQNDYPCSGHSWEKLRAPHSAEAVDVSCTPQLKSARLDKRPTPGHLSWLDDVTISDLKQAAWIRHSHETPDRDDKLRIACRQDEKMEIDAMCVAASAGIDLTSAKQVLRMYSMDVVEAIYALKHRLVDLERLKDA